MISNSLQTALLSISVSLSSLPSQPAADALARKATVDVTGETSRDDALNIGESEYAELFHVEDLPALARLDAQAEEYLETHPESLTSPESNHVRLEIRVNRAQQTMRVFLNGKEKWDPWKVSTGRNGSETRAGTYEPTAQSLNYYAPALGVVLPYGIKFDGGNLIHATGKLGEAYLGEKRTKGSIRLHPSSAKLLWSLVKQVGLDQTKIVIQ